MRNAFWGIVLILLGLLFLLDNMGMVDFGYVVRTYWPLLLIVWGASVLFKKKDNRGDTVFSDTSEKVTGELFHESSVFGDMQVEVSSQNFKGGSVSTVFGDCRVDLTKAAVAEGEHWLRISGVFGDVTVTLPEDTSVSVTSSALLGSVNVFDERKGGLFPDARHESADYKTASKKLRISVTQVFGDITVH